MENNNIIKFMKDMENIFISCATDAEKFVEGNNSAGTRVRKSMQTIKKLAQEVRLEIQKQKNTVTS
mgnify:CR=1 FL=1|tara:strand:+ start:200 stop:397 length:198 start_codon:yes stop_codon:yes gene_type:complete